jgi:hypothetical protein
METWCHSLPMTTLIGANAGSDSILDSMWKTFQHLDLRPDGTLL